jgi:acyl-CoA thioesterase-1
MTKPFFALILAILLLSGCRPSDGSHKPTKEANDVGITEVPSPAMPAGPPSASKNDPRPLLVCFGDSLTAGYGAEPGQSYPDYLQEDLDAKGFHYRVVNEGVSGATSKDGVERLPEIEKMKAAVVIVEFGGNDGLRGLPVKEMRANLDTIVHDLQASGAKVMLAGISLPPDYGPDYVNEFVASYPLIAKKYHVPLVPFLLQGVFGVDGMMQADRTHATAKGNVIVAKNMLPVVEPLLKK